MTLNNILYSFWNNDCLVLKLTKHPAHYTCTHTSNQVYKPYKPGDRLQTMFAHLHQQLMSEITHCAYILYANKSTSDDNSEGKIMNECLHNKKGEPIPFTQIARPVITVVHNTRDYISAMNLRLVMTSAMICTSYRVIQRLHLITNRYSSAI